MSEKILVNNGKEAVASIIYEYENSRPYDLVFMDCIMPVMSGWEAVEIIRKWESENNIDGTCKKHTVILAVTANATTEDKEKCLEIGMDCFLIKPITREGLYNVMTEWAGMNSTSVR